MEVVWNLEPLERGERERERNNGLKIFSQDIFIPKSNLKLYFFFIFMIMMLFFSKIPIYFSISLCFFICIFLLFETKLLINHSLKSLKIFSSLHSLSFSLRLLFI